MPADPILGGAIQRVRRFAHGRRRLLIAGYLGLLALGLLVIGLPPLRAAAAARVEQVMRSVQGGWIERVDRGEALVDAGRYEEAIAYLTALDDRFPARTNRHALDRERERVLHALGRAYVATDRKGSALDAFRRAVLFDPRNVENHFALARTALHFAEPEEALLHLDRVLAIHPSHRGALSAAVALAFEDGAYARVVERMESYLDAFRVHPLPVSVGTDTAWSRVPVDGRVHEVRVPLPATARAARVEIRPDHPGLEVLAAFAEGRAFAGRAGAAGDSATIAREDGLLRVELPGPPGGTAALRLTVRARAPVDAETWEQVRTSYRNRLAHEALEAAERRTVRLSPEGAP